jgi:hypothetical protein
MRHIQNCIDNNSEPGLNVIDGTGRVLLRVRLRMRTLFEPSSNAAVIDGASRPSHPLCQAVYQILFCATDMVPSNNCANQRRKM